MIEKGLFKGETPMLKHRQRGVTPLGRRAIACCDSQVELRKVMTAEMVGEITR
jgi:hypothetical protein